MPIWTALKQAALKAPEHKTTSVFQSSFSSSQADNWIDWLLLQIGALNNLCQGTPCVKFEPLDLKCKS